MKMFEIIRGVYLQWRRSSKIMQNVIFHVKLHSLTLKQSNYFASCYPNETLVTKTSLKVGSHDPILVQLSFQIFCARWKTLAFTQSNVSHPIISWCTPEKHDNSCFENLGPFHRSLGPAVAAILWKYFAESSVGKLKIGGSFDLIGWK